MKKCSRCKEEKEVSYFNKKGTGLSSYCKECNKIKLLEHYNNNKDYYKTKRSVFRQTTKTAIQELKSKLKCEHCGEDHIACLDFHHKNPENKYKTVAELTNSSSLSKVLEEMEKCIVLCANCHRKLHYNETH